MSTGTYLGLCLSLLVICVSLGSSASDQEILGHLGMSVTLTFQVPTGNVSVWLKRLHNDKYIFYCRDGNPVRPSDQEESFKGRVEGMDCNRINGTVSVTLKNLTRNDNGTYEFHSVDRDEKRFNKTVFLTVTDPGQIGGHTEDGGKEAGASRGHTPLTIILSGFCVIVLCVCGCIHQSAAIKWVKNCFKKNSPFSPLPNNEANRELQQSANNSLV